MEQVEGGYPDEPFPFDTGGQLLAGNDPQVVNPAFIFSAPRGDRLGAEDDLKGSRADRVAAAVRPPVHLPTWGRLTPAVGTCQEGGTDG